MATVSFKPGLFIIILIVAAAAAWITSVFVVLNPRHTILRRPDPILDQSFIINNKSPKRLSMF
ncbi:hypothetical protein NC652_036179 [Populus alba x Populus x berolinensis]|nr:hypothetical protein NC652_036179 [Populus alba x Populus x berolinensis]